MYYVYSIGIFVLSMVVMGAVLRFLRRRGRPSIKAYAPGYLLAVLTPAVLMWLVIAITSWYYYDGLCYATWECSFWEYLQAELPFAQLYLSPSVGLSIAGITLTFAFHWFFARRGYFQDEKGRE